MGGPTRFVLPWGGCPQGAPLPIRFALGRAPTRGAPTDSFCLGEGTHKGRPYRFVLPWGGCPQGAPLPIRFALGRAPTRGAPTDSFCPGEGTHKGRPYPIRFALGRAPTRGAPTRFVLPWGGCPLGAPLPDSGSLTWVCPNMMQLPWGGAGGVATHSGASLIFAFSHSCIRSSRFSLSMRIVLMKQSASS